MIDTARATRLFESKLNNRTILNLYARIQFDRSRAEDEERRLDCELNISQRKCQTISGENVKADKNALRFASRVVELKDEVECLTQVTQKHKEATEIIDILVEALCHSDEMLQEQCGLRRAFATLLLRQHRKSLVLQQRLDTAYTVLRYFAISTSML